jgi:LssY C-terminus
MLTRRITMRRLPPDKLVTRRKDGKLYYVYADAAGCSRSGSATFDRGVGLSRYTGQVTHHIAPDIDAERDALTDDLKKAKVVEASTRLPASARHSTAAMAKAIAITLMARWRFLGLSSAVTRKQRRPHNPPIVDLKNKTRGRRPPALLKSASSSQ